MRAGKGSANWRYSVTKKKSGADELIFLPLGGVGEIGMNLALYGLGPEADRKWLMVDCGHILRRPRSARRRSADA